MTEQDYHYSPFLIERNESWIIKKYRKHISKKPFSIGYQTWVGKPFLQLGRFQFDLYYKALIDIENNLAISFDKWIQNNIIYVTQESLQKINVYYMNANLNILNDFISMRRQVYDDTCKAAIGFALGTTSIQDFANLYRQMTIAITCDGGTRKRCKIW